MIRKIRIFKELDTFLLEYEVNIFSEDNIVESVTYSHFTTSDNTIYHCCCVVYLEGTNAKTV